MRRHQNEPKSERDIASGVLRVAPRLSGVVCVEEGWSHSEQQPALGNSV